jgi:hypothetical protein
MRSRLRSSGVYSLSAVDLFASAMGAFLVITIILMPDYQKEVRLEGHLAYLESLAAESRALLDSSAEGADADSRALQSARTLALELQAERDIVAAELETVNARLQASRDRPPPPAPTREDTPEDTGSNRVTFRFLGLKTDATRILIMVDMNRYLGEHENLVQRTILRALDSLGPGYQFGILGFQQIDSGARYHRWPENGELAVMSPGNFARARRFIDGLSGQFAGGSSLYSAFDQAFATTAEAIVLLSDGLPNPTFNQNLPPASLAQEITLINNRPAEIHAVTIGDYFKYRGTVEFMERLAAANNGDFLALAQ